MHACDRKRHHHCVGVCMHVCKREWRVRGYLKTETNQGVWDKKAAFMVYGNQTPLHHTPHGLPPPCIITTTYSHDWWNMRLWNLNHVCYRLFFQFSPLSFLLSQSFFVIFNLFAPLCICSGLRCLVPCTNKKLHTQHGVFLTHMHNTTTLTLFVS